MSKESNYLRAIFTEVLRKPRESCAQRLTVNDSFVIHRHWCNHESDQRNLTQFQPVGFMWLTDVALWQHLSATSSLLLKEGLLQLLSLLGRQTTFN